jgi:hypothetical protein
MYTTYKVRHKVEMLMMCIAISFLASCATIGIHHSVNKEDFGPPEPLRICMFQDEDISDAQRDAIIKALHTEFSRFAIDIQVPWVRPWKRTHFTTRGEAQKIFKCRLEAPCDRYMVLLGRNAGDVLYGMFLLPQLMGKVDLETTSKGVSVAEMEWSLNGLLNFRSPKSTAIHETYHLLGCRHQLDARVCYDIIKEMKEEAHKLRASGVDFFPSRNYKTGKILKERH